MTETVEVLLTEFRADIKRYEAALRRQIRETERTTQRNTRAFQKSNRSIIQSTDRMSRDVRRAIAAIGLGVAIREVTRFGNQYTDAFNKVAAASQISNLQASSLDDLAVAAGNARVSIEPYVDLYARLLRVAPAVAATEQEVARATDLVAKAFKAGGASAQEQAAGIIQIGQALGSGFLQGDELRSIRENAPLVAQAIAEEFDTTIGGLKELGAEGELVNDRVFAALLNSAEDIEAAFGATVPSATDAAERAFERLGLAVGEYVTNSDAAQDISQGIADVLDFVADNFDTLADAVIVATVALGTGGLVFALQRAQAALNAAVVSAGGFRAALVRLRATMATLAVPAALTIAAGVLASMALNAETAEDRLAKIRRGFEVLSSLKPSTEVGLTADEILRLSRMSEEAVEAVEDLNEAQREAVRLQRLQNQADQASAILRRREAIDQLREAAEAAQNEVIALYDELNQDPAVRVSRNLAEENTDYRRPGNGGNAETEVEFLRSIGLEEQAQLLDELNQRIRETIQLRQGLEALSDESFVLRDPNEGLDPSGGAPRTTIDVDEERAVLDEIATAHRDFFETELEQIKRVRDERLAAIDDVALLQAEKDAARVQANELYAASLSELKDREYEASQIALRAEKERGEAREEAVRRELALYDQVVAQRNAMLGLALTNIETEYEARRQQIEREISDQITKKRALIALEEEYSAFVEQERNRVLGEGEFSDNEIDRVRAAHEQKLEALREAQELEYITKEEHKQRLIELEEATENEIQAIRLASLDMQLQNGAKLFNGLAGMAQAFGGKQSGLYKSLFAVEKAFATASALVNIQQGMAEALSLPFPANLGAFAKVAALGATVVGNIAGVTANFRDGGIDIRGAGTGRSDSISANISRGESVITAAGTAANPNLLRAINAGANVEGALAGARAGSAVSIAGSTVIIEGDVTPDVFELLQGELDQRDAKLADDVLRINRRDQVRTVPRHRR